LGRAGIRDRERKGGGSVVSALVGRSGRHRRNLTPTNPHNPTTPTREEADAVATFKDLLEEIPVTLRNPGIVSALLFDMQVRICEWVLEGGGVGE
jgi:hypothetical protein